GHAQAEPFTYRTARALFAGTGREVRVNLAVRRTPKPHVAIRYLEPDFTRLFLDGLRGLGPDGEPDHYYRGRELARNAAVGELALATGMRLQEFSSLLTWEIPPLPPQRVQAPIPFPVPSGIAKGRKFRTTWISYDALAAVHHYLEVDRPATVDGTGWRPPARAGEPLLVTGPDERGGRVNGVCGGSGTRRIEPSRWRTWVEWRRRWRWRGGSGTRRIEPERWRTWVEWRRRWRWRGGSSTSGNEPEPTRWRGWFPAWRTWVEWRRCWRWRGGSGTSRIEPRRWRR
ncbi:MAG: hypothetical protein ACLQIB_50030, partial [Isosphaeraceae bacterium]